MYLPKETNIAFIFIELAILTDLTFPLYPAFYNISILRLSTAVSASRLFVLTFCLDFKKAFNFKIKSRLLLHDFLR